MAEPTTPDQVLDPYEGHTYGTLLSEILDQDGSEVDASDSEKERYRRWIKTCVIRTSKEVPGYDQRRRTVELSYLTATTDYALDYDVDSVIRAAVGDVIIPLMHQSEYAERLDQGNGTWPGPKAVVLVGMDINRRWIVRPVGFTEAATIDFEVERKMVDKRVSDEDVLPLPSVFHDAAEACCLIKLYRRQGDLKAKEDAMRDLELGLESAKRLYRPFRSVRRSFRSAAAEKSGLSRQPGRHRHFPYRRS